MTAARPRRRWTEQDAPEPLDLRLAVPALAVWAGCLIGWWAAQVAWWAAGAVAVGAASLLAAPRLRRRAAGLIAVLVCLAAATILTAVKLHVATADPLVRAGVAGEWVTAEVVVTGDPVAVTSRWAGRGGTDGRWRVTGRARSAEIRGAAVASHASVTVFGGGPAWASVVPGQTLMLSAGARPDAFGTLPGVVLRPRGDPVVLAGPPWWSAWAVSARAALTRTAATLDTDRGGLLRGLVVGDTRGIDDALSADAKSAGLTHLVAVSGTHMAVVSGAVFLLLRRCGPRWSAVGAALALVAMVVLVGPQPSVLRSVAMGLIAVSAAMLGRPRAALPGLSAAVFVLLLTDPTLAVSAGFALSVQATAALVLLAPTWVRALQRRGVPHGWATLIALPVAAHLATMPVIAAISGNVSLVAIPANVAVAPIVTPALLLGLGSVATGPWWPTAARALARADGPLLGWITGTAHRLARWPSATVPWPASAAGVLTLAALIVVTLEVLRHRRVRAAAMAAIVGVAAVLVPARVVAVGWPVAGWLITACEVGQGDAMVLSTGIDGAAVVVDTGPDPDVVDSCLRRLGITSIAMVVLTHLHADHVDGLAGVVRGRSVGGIGLGPDRSSPSAMAAVAATAAALGVPVVRLDPGRVLTAGELTLTVLGPGREFRGTDSDANNDSVVLRATRDGVRMLMTGDIEREAQQALLQAGVDLRADVLKQPHHGSSKLLPEFVAAVGARVAVIGVGQRNDYGHPAAAALAADRAAGVTRILRTDTDGDVQVCRIRGELGAVSRGAHLSGRAARPAVARPAD